jgi:trans-aconitate methyltransferase
VALARAGFRVTGLDYASAAVETLRARLAEDGLGAEVVDADILAWEPTAQFEAVYEQTCLCALPPERWEDYEQRLASWLVPGGSLAAAFMQTDASAGPPFACAPSAMRRLFAAERWDWPAELTPVGHPLGLVELAGILRRRSPEAIQRWA